MGLTNPMTFPQFRTEPTGGGQQQDACRPRAPSPRGVCMAWAQVDACGRLQELQLVTPLLSILHGTLGGPERPHRQHKASVVTGAAL